MTGGTATFLFVFLCSDTIRINLFAARSSEGASLLHALSAFMMRLAPRGLLETARNRS